MILHRRGENNDGFRNGVESVHAALAASEILKKSGMKTTTTATTKNK